MERTYLSNTSDWALQFDDQDVRGYEAVDPDGNHVGEVAHMIVNPDEERVDAIVLEDGTEYPARDISIGDGVVYLTAGHADAVIDRDTYGYVSRRELKASGSYQDHRDDFRGHYETTYAETDASFEDVEPAYRYGYETAYEDDFRNRPYSDAEGDLRSRFETQLSDYHYEGLREAVRYGYATARGDRR